MRRRTPRPGISLTETLLVLAIVALLLALLLPAIQRVREAANSMACANHLRAIGNAFADMTAGNQAYPMGGAVEAVLQKSWAFHFSPGAPEVPTTRDRQNLGWAFQILPSLGHDAVWRENDLFLSTSPEPEFFSYQRAIPQFLCPSRSRGKLVLRPNFGGSTVAVIDYAANAGHLSFVDPASGRQFRDHTRPYSLPLTATTLSHTGLVGASRYVTRPGLRIDPLLRPSEVTDGLAHTLLVGEKRINRGLAGAGTPAQPQPGDQLGWYSGFSTDTVRTGAYAPRRDATAANELVVDGFGAAHSAGWWSLFADGSVRRLRYNDETGTPGNLSLLQRLCHRRDGGTVTAASLE